MNNHIEEKFYKELVEMSPLKGRDMHNRPPLYDTPDEKIEEIKQFIKQALQEQRQSILEEIYKELLEDLQHDKNHFCKHYGECAKCYVERKFKELLK